jgi:tetratricopeptide (TPR) repeat protein
MTQQPAQVFAEAKRLQQEGRLEDAIEAYRRAVALRPDYFEAWNNLGNALRSVRRFDESIASVREALRLRPDLAAIHSNLGLALAAVGRFEEAAASQKRAIELMPDFAPAHNNLGLALRGLDRAEESLLCYERAIELAPGFVEAHRNRAAALQSLKRLDEAASSYERALQLDPACAEAHYNLANVFRDLKRLDDAIASYRRSLERKSDLIEAHLNLGDTLRELGRPDEAVVSFERVLAMDARHLAAYRGLGMALREMNRLDDAVAAYRSALELVPDNAELYLDLGGALQEAGKFAEAREACETARRLDPTLAGAYLSLVQSSTILPHDPLLADIEALERDSQVLPADQRASLLFALGKAYGDIGRHDDAFVKLLEANALRRAGISHDEAAVRDRFDAIHRVFTRELIAEKGVHGSDSELSIFIVGFPRSGTTLTEQILASHPEVHGAGELPYIGELAVDLVFTSGAERRFPDYVPLLSGDDVRRFGEDYAARVRRLAPTARRITDKMPDNYRLVGLIRTILPKARVVHVRRDALDTCVSCFSLSFGSEISYVYDLGELGRRYAMYAELMEHWRRVLPRGAMLEVQYEDLVEDLENQARRIVDFCGLPWDDRCLAFHATERAVRTASVSQVRQPIYRSSIQRWRRYEKHLGPLIEALGPYARTSAPAET